MRDLRPLAVAAIAVGVSGDALALPWSLDMVDAVSVKSYEKAMTPLPEGVASQPNLLTPVAWRKNYAWTAPERTTMTNPLDAGAEGVLVLGERMYDIYCWTCHGRNAELGPVWEKGMAIIPPLGGPNGRLQNLPDGHVYLTIRNGSQSKLMGAYGYAMTETEMWSIVAYMRTQLDNAAYVPPQTVESP